MFSSKVNLIMSLLTQGGASEVLVVGGYVRDHILGLPSKDVDLEVYGLDYARILEILQPCFRANLVGQSFGVLKVDNEIDVALPRRESKQGVGHKGFEVQPDLSLDPMTAFARRDFTINAIGMRQDGSLVDPYHGADDIKRKILRATSIAFKDDPLRVLRGMQFASRFGFTMDDQTITWCRDVFCEFPTLSEERIYMEWEKWATKGLYPSFGLNVLLQTGWIAAFPELQALVGCEQSPQWHSEGDAWEHTKMVCDAMGELIRQANDSDEPFTQEEQIALMFAALLHDVGKPETSFLGEDGLIHSHGHAPAGGDLAESFLRRMKAPVRVFEMVRPLVTEHMAFFDGAETGLKGVRRLACRLTPANVRLWAHLCQA
ncbi:MAG: HD domain-containing protein, partial [Thermoguttaceae bacterium]|nr:HD domain-containing protein [Thermoguttaceae bacterium]